MFACVHVRVVISRVIRSGYVLVFCQTRERISVSLMQQAGIDKLRRMAGCIVSYLDTDGMRHTVEVEAESLYEATALAVRTFRQHGCEPGRATKIDVEIRTSVTHTLTLGKVQDWLTGGTKTPKEAILKERLGGLLSMPSR